MSRDKRIDDYIAKAAPFAQPILTHVRERVHAVLPDVEEAIKWGMPSYLRGGKILLNTAAFKAHAAINFWRAGKAESEGMGQFGKLTDVSQLPADLDDRIRLAAASAMERRPPKPPKPPLPASAIHAEFLRALMDDPEAAKNFDNLAPSHRRDYTEWIAEAKRDETRKKRIAQAIEWLREGKHRNWKYEAR